MLDPFLADDQFLRLKKALKQVRALKDELHKAGYHYLERDARHLLDGIVAEVDKLGRLQDI